MKVKYQEQFAPFALILILILSPTMIAIPLATAQTARQTISYVSVFPTTIGVGQNLLINAWVAPNPENNTNPQKFHGVSLVLTKPDGTSMSVIPNQEAGLAPGETEASGTIFYVFVPDTVGTWKVKLVFPGENFGGFVFAASNSPDSTFTVQQQPVTVGTKAPPLPTQNNNWTSPVNAENYNWYTLNGPWLETGYNSSNSAFNPYTTAPNTAHILWTQQTTFGGIAGGDWGSFTMSGSGIAPTTILMGRIYFNMADGIHCISLYTGQTIWVIAGARFTTTQLTTVTALAAGTTISVEQTGGPNAYLWDLNPPAYHRYDALTGALQLTVPNALYGPQVFGSVNAWDTTTGVAYIMVPTPNATTGPNGVIIPSTGVTSNGNPGGYLLCWNSSKAGVATDWKNGIQWNVTVPVFAGPSPTYTGDTVVEMNYNQRMVAYDAITGRMLWDTGPLNYQIYTAKVVGDGKAYVMTDFNRTWHAFDVHTGNVVWSSEQADYPYGGFVSYTPVIAYGNLYTCSYDGHVYAYNDKNGQTLWKFFSGATNQAPYNEFPFYQGPLVAGGKVFAGVGEHTPTEPYWSGARLYAIDAFNGSQVWSIAGLMMPSSAAFGYLLASNAYDGLTYCFGKGNTATTVTAPENALSQGTSVMFQGTVTDQSPGAKGSPAISDRDMSSWMEYQYMQKAKPTNATGVTVHLTALDPNGNTQDIGYATSDLSGSYAIPWTPPVPGVYTVTASFDGSESYFPSASVTHINVVAAASPSAQPKSTPVVTAPPTSTPTITPTTSAPSTTSPSPSIAPPPTSTLPATIYVAIAAVIAIIVVIAAALILRRRK